jgi:chorismate dehydratase
MRRLRISAISYLNTAPLMWDFQHSAAGADFEISYTVPSHCAEQLRSGAADIGIIPAITYATIPGLVILPEVAIAAKNAVRSIALVSKVPLEQITTVATDAGSRTSVALLRLLFQKWLGGERDFREMPPELDSMLRSCDAGLLIGDPALQVQRQGHFVYDLGELWRKFTGKPFVFAFWAVRLAALDELRPGLELGRTFRDSRDHGLAHVQEIAREWAPRLGLSKAEIVAYLTRNICYSLDADCLEGLELFFRYSAECGLIPDSPMLRFLGSMAMACRGC